MTSITGLYFDRGSCSILHCITVQSDVRFFNAVH